MSKCEIIDYTKYTEVHTKLFMYKVKMSKIKEYLNNKQVIGIIKDDTIVGCFVYSTILDLVDMNNSKFTIEYLVADDRVCLKELILFIFSVFKLPIVADKVQEYLVNVHHIPTDNIESAIRSMVVTSIGLDKDGVLARYKTGSIEAYTSKYEDQFALAIDSYFKEMHPTEYVGNLDKARELISDLSTIEGSRILLAISTKGELEGFITVSSSDQYGMLVPSLFVEYMYIIPSKRNGRMVALMYAALAKLAGILGMEITSSTLSSSKNISNAEIVGASAYCTMYRFTKEVLNGISDKYGRFLS